MVEPLSRELALGVLRDGHQQVLALIDGLSRAQMARPGLGGGDWSVKDLLGHLTSWEEHALDALDAWSEGRAVPIYEMLGSLGIDGVNQRTFEEKSGLSYAEVLLNFATIQERLLRTIGGMSDEIWRLVPIPERNRTLGSELGGILSGHGDFDHAAVHLPDLQTWVGDLRTA